MKIKLEPEEKEEIKELSEDYEKVRDWLKGPLKENAEEVFRTYMEMLDEMVKAGKVKAKKKLEEV